MKTRPTIAVALHDGWYGCGTGAGYANYGFLEALADSLPAEARLVLLPVELSPDSWEHQAAWHDRARRLIDAEILPVDNGTGGQDRWGGLANFERLCEHTAERIRREVLPGSGPLLLIAFDVPFFGLPARLPRSVRAHTVLVPRSSGLIHTPDGAARIAWERAGLHAGLADGTRIGAISRYLDRHLREDYGIPPSSLISLRDGLSPSEWAAARSRRPDSGIPGEFLLAMGRAQPYKGFDDLLDAMTILRRRGRDLPHLVFAATGESPHPSGYQRSLMARADRLGVECTTLTRFTPQVAGLLTAPGLRGVVVPSRAEPFGRIPMEAFAAGAAPVITTTAGGLAEQVVDGHTGFACPPGSPAALAEALGRALDTDQRERATMRSRAFHQALRTYDQLGTVRRFLGETAPWLELPGADDRLRWLSSTEPAVLAGSPVSAVPPVKVPIGRQAGHWNTVVPQRLVLVVVHHATSLDRLLDVITVFDSDPRVQVVFSLNGSDPFQHGLQPLLDRLGAVLIPWHQAIETEFDLVIAANHGGLTEISSPLVIIPHGAGYTKNSPGNRKPETGNRKPETGNRSVFGLAPEWLLYNGQPIADSLVLSHEEQLSRLAAATPEALGTAVVAGDPCFDRILRSRHLRGQYRRALGVEPGQKLVTVATTWSKRSLMGSWPSLFRELLAALPADEYRVAASMHPNVWHGHGPWQVHTWLADCVRAGLLLAPPEEGWQALLIAADLVVGDYGAASCYAAGVGGPVLLAAFPEEEVAPGSAADRLGALAPRLHRHTPLRAQLDAAMRDHKTTALAPIREALTSCPGESAARLRTLFYGHLDLPEPGTPALIPVITLDPTTIPPRPAALADHVVLSLEETVTLSRFPADVSTGERADSHLDDALLVVHENHPRRDLLDRAAVILVDPAPDQRDRETALDDALHRNPGAALAAAAAGELTVVRSREGALATLKASDPVAASALVHEWRLAGRSLDTLPPVTTIAAGPRLITVELVSVLAEPAA
ncbi:glycosyltransferase family 4 protein [Amycolatopsis saalfeldensis]|uniref:Glycosyltransferase involved in cell wall bisynthesis n=1 Tax=Amycolatopsis saalfeldensis TaxID=394193 RepID=A0A1H8RFG1_9PSEU|nr:glycosyltransferase family 4 protein [Amycolatopsis saalfeldensis]SEO64753.1 Glycosyltransferase involved in cell wall bisynthesis [Amycolatopsis saalfeldensis]